MDIPNFTPKHDNTTCPRCGRAFVCKASAIAHCDCAHISLREEVLDYIAVNYDECLCLDCLQALQRAIKPVAS